MKKRKLTGLKGRIAHFSTVNSMIMVLIAMVILTIFSFMFLSERSKRMQVAEVKQVDNEIDGWLDEQTANVNSIATAIEYVYNSMGDQEKYIQNYLTICLAQNPEVFEYYIGLDSGEIYYGSGYQAKEGYDPRERGWYIDAVEAGTTVVSENYVDAQTGKLCLTISRPIYYGDKLIGVVATDIYTDHMVEVAAEADQQSLGELILLDRDGYIMYHNNDDYKPQSISEGEVKMTSHEEIGIVGDWESNGGKVFYRSSFEGVYRAIYNEETGVTVIDVMPWLTYYRPVNTLVILWFLIIAVETVFYKRRAKMSLEPIFGSLSELSVVAENMSMGFLAYESNYEEDDEIGMLCTSVEQSNRVIRQYIASITEQLDRMAVGDYSEKIKIEYTGDFVPLKVSVNNALKSNRAIVLKFKNDVERLNEIVASFDKADGKPDTTEADELLSEMYDLIETFKLDANYDPDAEDEVLF